MPEQAQAPQEIICHSQRKAVVLKRQESPASACCSVSHCSRSTFNQAVYLPWKGQAPQTQGRCLIDTQASSWEAANKGYSLPALSPHRAPALKKQGPGDVPWVGCLSPSTCGIHRLDQVSPTGGIPVARCHARA